MSVPAKKKPFILPKLSVEIKMMPRYFRIVQRKLEGSIRETMTRKLMIVQTSFQNRMVPNEYSFYFIRILFFKR